MRMVKRGQVEAVMRLERISPAAATTSAATAAAAPHTERALKMVMLEKRSVLFRYEVVRNMTAATTTTTNAATYGQIY